MAKFDLDNEGSGFNLESDDDLESMLDRASAASEDDDGNPGGTVNAPDMEMAPFLEDDEDGVETPAKAPLPSEEVASEEELAPLDPIAFEPEPTKTKVEKTPDSEVDTEVKETAKTSRKTAQGRMRIPTEGEQIQETLRIIQILDVYRSLTDREKTVAIQFVTNGDLDQADDSTLVVKVLNADPTLTTTMRALREAYECEAVERAFFAMSLETKTLHALGSLVSVFSSEDYDESQSNLVYSRNVVAAISKLDDSAINYVKATESVLSGSEIAQE